MKTLMMISIALVGCSNNQVPEEAKPLAKAVDPIERGKHLVITSGCHDCHTPFKLGPKGAEPDFSRALSGHPAELVMPPAPELPPGPWLMSVAATNTAWAGPWGVSFTANLTPDKETGLGTWSEATFVATIRNAKHQGVGRPLLPPMPAGFYAQMPDEDLGAIYAYLRTVPAIKNQVPTPVPPKGAAAAAPAPKGPPTAAAMADTEQVARQ